MSPCVCVCICVYYLNEILRNDKEKENLTSASFYSKYAMRFQICLEWTCLNCLKATVIVVLDLFSNKE